MILIDTNVISELRKARPHGGVLAWYQQHPLTTLYVSSISIYELQAGTERTREIDPDKARELDRWIADVQDAATILPFGSLEAKVTAQLMRHRSRDLLEDAMIAATAIAQAMPIATRNTRDFEPFGVPLVNPFLFNRH